ncbi:MAG: MobA/MobL family protein [Desulfurivibrionaceae bacterium]
MAIFHLHVRTGSRAKGQSAVAKARYILREGKYKKDRDEVLFSQSGNMPAWAAASPLKYWRSADDLERANGVLFREMDLALPVELDLAQKIQLAKKFALEAAEGKLPYTMGLHRGKDHNPHLHLMLSERINDGHRRTPETWFKRAAPAGKPPEGGGARKADIGSQRKPWLQQIRERWAEMANEALAAAGFSVRIDHRTLAEQGENRLAQIHMGPAAVEMEEKGRPTDRVDRALEIAVANQLAKEMKEIDREINHERNRASETGQKPAATNKGAASRTPPSKPAHHQTGKGVARHGQSPEKAPAAPLREAKHDKHSGPVVHQEGPKMSSYDFQANIDSRRRRKKWASQSKSLQLPPAGTSWAAAERRRDLFSEWQWLGDPAEIRRRAVAASRQGGELSKLAHEQYLARKSNESRNREVYYLRQKIEGLKPLQIFEKKRLGEKLREAEKALAQVKEEQKRLSLAEKKLIQSCPPELVDKFRHQKEEEREKSLAALLRREAEEAAEERRKEEAEAKARAERLAMRPAAKSKKPGGWSPPSPG